MGFGGQNSQQKANDAQIKGLTSNITNAANTAGTRADKSFKFFKQSTKPALDFWNTILSGDTNAITKLLSPEVSNISNTYNNAKQNLWNSPRGGGKVSAVQELEAGQARDINNLFNAVRPQAASQLTNLGGLFNSAAQGYTGQQLGGFEGASNNLFGLNKEQEEMQRRNAAAWGALGQGLGGIVGSFFAPGSSLFGGGSSGGGGVSSLLKQGKNPLW